MPNINANLATHISNKGHANTVNADGDVTITGTLSSADLLELIRAAYTQKYDPTLVAGALKFTKR